MLNYEQPEIPETPTMTSRDFTYWLQGFFELSNVKTLNKDQVKQVKQHLQACFSEDPKVTFRPNIEYLPPARC
jgi:hypothetical protein